MWFANQLLPVNDFLKLLGLFLEFFVVVITVMVSPSIALLTKYFTDQVVCVSLALCVLLLI